jgi:hypothetical protein
MDVRLEVHHARAALTRELRQPDCDWGSAELSREPRAHRARRHLPTILPGESPAVELQLSEHSGAPAQTRGLEKRQQACQV